MVEIPRYDKIPPVVRYHGNIEEAKRHRGEALHVLNRLRTQKSFQDLSQDVLRRKLSNGVKVTTKYVMNTPYVDIYAPIIEEKIEEKEKELKACFIQPLTHTVKPWLFPKPSCVDSVGFCMSANKDCDISLVKWQRKFKDKEVGYVQNLSQCKYCYKENEGEDDEIKRRASLFHYDNVWPIGGYTRIVRVVNYSGTADFELGIPIFIPPGGVVDLVGALSKDLARLYISLYSASGYIPLKERSLHYFVYDLVEVNGERKWEFSGGGKTPIGYTYVDNVLTRDGNCGCWQLDVEAGDKEVVTLAGTKEASSCCPTAHSSSGSGGNSWQSGTIVTPRYVTFSLELESFGAAQRMEGFHLSPYSKDYVVCLAHGANEFEFGGVPAPYATWDCVCNTYSCGYCAAFGDGIRVARLNDSQVYEAFMGGLVTSYHLYNGLNTYAPLWGKFFSDYYQLFESTFKMERDHCPCPETGFTGAWSGFGSGHNYQGYGSRDLLSQYTTLIARNTNVNERDVIFYGDCGYDGTSYGHNIRPLCLIGAVWVCRDNAMGSAMCHNHYYNDPGFGVVKQKEYLSPLEIILQDGESIGNSFISYDEETDSLIRGVRYKALDKKWYWYIKAKIPVRNDDEPFSVIKDCEDKKIDQELKLLLSDEHYSRLEAIIFIEDIKEK